MFNFKNTNPLPTDESNKDTSELSQSFASDEKNESQLHQKPEAQSYPTVISQGVCLNGDLFFNGTLYLDGEVIGNITGNQVNIGALGVLDGELITEILNISGKASGRIHCQKLLIKAGAIVSASVKYQQLEIQQGAQISGELVHDENFPFL